MFVLFLFFYIWKSNHVVCVLSEQEALWEDLYSTVSQSGQNPPDESCETGERKGDGGGGGGQGAASWSWWWWAHLWWHHHGGVWLVCLIARERHWCLELDLYYAAEQKKREGETKISPEEKQAGRAFTATSVQGEKKNKNQKTARQRRSHRAITQKNKNKVKRRAAREY